MNSNSQSKKNTYISSIVFFIIIPICLFLFWKFGNKHYYLASIVILLYTFVPFFSSFENRKPQAKEFVALASLCAIAVISRAIFVAIPHFKPMSAIIIIASVAFGAQAGFLTGSMSLLTSNFIFGQGPWTPWQMFAYGMAGFISGLLYEKGIIKREKLPLAIFGFFLVVFVVGPILDTCAIFTMSSMINTSVVGAVYLSGLPVNLIHAFATFLTIYFFSNPMFEKLDRLKLKYGLMDDEI